MESVLYLLVQFGIDPCILKLICKSWMETIQKNDDEIIESIQWRMPDKHIHSIILMLIESGDAKTIYRLLFHLSKPAIDWNLSSYLIENKQIAEMIMSRVNTPHTNEMCRRLSIPVPIPIKSTFIISAIIKSVNDINKNFTPALGHLISIISNGYLDAFVNLLDKLGTNEFGHLIGSSISMIVQSDKPFNCAIIYWLLKSDKYRSLLPSNTGRGKVTQSTTMFRISMDMPNGIKNIPLWVLPYCGSKLLSFIVKNASICRDYLKQYSNNIMSIRLIDAIIRQSRDDIAQEKAKKIADDNGWNSYLAID